MSDRLSITKHPRGQRLGWSAKGRGRRKITSSEASHRGLRVLFMGLLMLGMGQSLFFVVLPPIARDIGLSEMETGIIFSLSAAAWVFCSPFWGRQSDRWGRRTVMVIGLSGFALSTLLVAAAIFIFKQGWLSLAFVLPTLIASRAIFGIFGSGTMPAAQAYIADRTVRAKRAKGVSLLTASFGIGNIIGPGFAAGLVVFGFLVPFVFVGIMGFCAAMIILLLLPDRHRGRFRKKEEVRMSMFAPQMRPFVILGILSSYAQAVLIQLSAFYFIDRLNLATDEATQIVGIALTFMALAALFAQFVIIQKFEPSVQWLLRYSSVILIAAFVGLAMSENYGLMTLSLGLAGLGFGLMRPGLMAAASLAVGRRNQGSAAGAINGTAAIGHVINPFTGAVLYGYYQAGPFWVVVVCMVVFLLLAFFHPRIRALGEKVVAPDQDISAAHFDSSVAVANPTPLPALRATKKRAPSPAQKKLTSGKKKSMVKASKGSKKK